MQFLTIESKDFKWFSREILLKLNFYNPDYGGVKLVEKSRHAESIL